MNRFLISVECAFCGIVFQTRLERLVTGVTKSCGCLRRKLAALKPHRLIHGQARRGKQSGMFRRWVAMRRRCDSPKDKSYAYYGGRGIQVCERWLVFKNFYRDMGECPKNMSLDRINNNGNYEPTNCRWADWSTQMKNRGVRR